MHLKTQPWFGSLSLAQSPGVSDSWFSMREDAPFLGWGELYTASTEAHWLLMDGKHGMIHDRQGFGGAVWAVWTHLGRHWHLHQDAAALGFTRAAVGVNTMLEQQLLR